MVGYVCARGLYPLGLVMKTFLTSVALIGAFLLASAGPAIADDIHLCDNATACSNNAMTLTSSSNLYLFGSNPTGGDVYLAVFTPESGTTGNFSASTSFLSALDTIFGETLAGPSQPKFKDFESNYNGASGLTAGSFDLSAIDLGVLNVTQTPTLITGVTIPEGDVAIAFILNGANVEAVSPNSSDFVIGTPEPSDLLLLALGLCGLCLLKLRRPVLNC